MGISTGSLIKRGKTYHWKYRLDGYVRWESLNVSSKHDAELVRQARITEFHTSRDSFLREEINPTLEELKGRYAEWAEHHVRPKTLEAALWSVGYLQRLSRCKSIGEMAPNVVGRIKTGMRRDGLSNVSTNNALRAMRAFVNRARKEGWYNGNNPFAEFEALPQEKKKPRWLNEEQIESVLAVAEEYSGNAHLVFTLGIYAGLRKNEIVNAKWEWVNFRGKYIHIQSSDTFHIKDHEERTVPLHDRLREVLQLYREKTGYVIAPEKEPGKYRYRFDIRKGFDAVCNDACVPWCTPHILRHTFASQLVSKGVSLAKVGTWLGHADLSTTQIYAHLAPHDEDINRM